MLHKQEERQAGTAELGTEATQLKFKGQWKKTTTEKGHNCQADIHFHNEFLSTACFSGQSSPPYRNDRTRWPRKVTVTPRDFKPLTKRLNGHKGLQGGWCKLRA